jgi:hypothetical protein
MYRACWSTGAIGRREVAQIQRAIARAALVNGDYAQAKRRIAKARELEWDWRRVKLGCHKSDVVGVG